jgi:hypothetical protein
MEQLTDLELIALKWQYQLFGNFYQLLMKLISQADEQNLQSLKLAFPQHVEAYVMYKTISGWWDKVREKATKLKWIPTAS